jgi:hypothetical protein
MKKFEPTFGSDNGDLEQRSEPAAQARRRFDPAHGFGTSIDAPTTAGQ